MTDRRQCRVEYRRDTAHTTVSCIQLYEACVGAEYGRHAARKAVSCVGCVTLASAEALGYT